MRRRTGVMGAAMLLAVGCTGSNSDAEPLPDGVAVAVFRDRSDENVVSQFHDVPVLLVSDDGVAYMEPPTEFAAVGELLPDVWVQSVTAAGVERVRSREVTTAFVPDDLPALAGSENVGPLQFYLPDAYIFAATRVEQAGDAPVLTWPTTASISLAEADDCQVLPEVEIGEAFETAAAGSLFEDNGVVYSVLAKQAWPGATCSLSR